MSAPDPVAALAEALDLVEEWADRCRRLLAALDAERARPAAAEAVLRDAVRYQDEQRDPVLAIRPQAALSRLASASRAVLATQEAKP